MKLAIETIIPLSKDIDDFLKRLESSGHEVKRGKYISVRAPGQERFTRTKTLGVDYTEEAITKRIAGDYTMIAAVAAAFDTAADALKAAEKRLADMAGLIKHISKYLNTAQSHGRGARTGARSCKNMSKFYY